MLRYRWPDQKGMSAFSLIGILVAVAAMAAIAVAVIPGYVSPGMSAKDAPPGKAATPIQRAESVECQTNLTQIRSAISMYQTNNEKIPASLQELGTFGLSSTMMYCPVGGATYTYGYDPQSGKAACRYPGHERF